MQQSLAKLRTQLKIDPISKHGELALLLVHLFKRLHDLSGWDFNWIQYFLKTKNRVTSGVPKEQIETVRGLILVLNFVEAIRS
ncbi:hypothetical protein B1202_16000 [Acinetobacter amyesii]|uniref:Antitoxin Xre/MbcA/ParS-like toxin-binding domain-containing protein n=1 Tax=Acinetobacter amyesii TaxID=2942470 RepID=A0A1T1GPX2_9GAMM|nr:hypothetical protein B1202_16000 [Acinetobacter amyesii]